MMATTEPSPAATIRRLMERKDASRLLYVAVDLGLAELLGNGPRDSAALAAAAARPATVVGVGGFVGRGQPHPADSPASRDGARRSGLLGAYPAVERKGSTAMHAVLITFTSSVGTDVLR